MRPIGIDTSNGKEMLVFKCGKCGQQGRNRTSSVDDRDAIIRLLREIASAGVVPVRNTSRRSSKG